MTKEKNRILTAESVGWQPAESQKKENKTEEKKKKSAANTSKGGQKVRQSNRVKIGNPEAVGDQSRRRWKLPT